MHVRKAVLWSLEGGRFGRGLVASGLSGGAACSLWRNVWVLAGRNKLTAAQPGAAPDRPQCCRFSSVLARLVVGRDRRAAGELSVLSLRAAWLHALELKEDYEKIAFNRRTYCFVYI